MSKLKVFAPSYYQNFSCIADKCKNNCCIGWEIDIDSKSLADYKNKQDIIQFIELSPTPHFRLTHKERCPFLDQNNLCYIIKNYGQESLCQICSDHPRFRNYYDTRLEIGLGLTCEAAAQLILDNDFSLTEIGDEETDEYENSQEIDFFAQRDALFSTDINSLRNFLPRLQLKDISQMLYSLERLDNSWDTYLDKIKDSTLYISQIEIADIKIAQRLFSYFIFRYYSSCSLTFCLLCTFIILSIDGDIYDIARMFSSEIEYSDENINKIIELL